MSSLKAGVVGVGSLGFHHLRILREVDAVEVTGFWEIQSDRAARVEEELEVPAAGSLDELLDRSEAVVVAVPTEAHEEVARRAVARGVHALVEKPIAPTVEAADRILDDARETGAVVQIGHVERFNPAVLAAEPHLEDPLFVESHRLAPFVARGTDVAVVLDLMIHDVDLVLSLVDPGVREIAAVGIPVLTPRVDIANARLTFESGAVANLTASRVSMERMRKLRIFQPSGYLSLDLSDGTGEFLRLKRPVEPDDLAVTFDAGAPGPGGGDADEDPALAGLGEIAERIPLEGRRVEPLREELEDFRDAILDGKPPAVSGEDGRAALAVALSIVQRIEDHVVDTRPA